MADLNLLQSVIGQRIGYGNWGALGIGGQCGEFTSWWLTQLTGGQYQFGTGVQAREWTPSKSWNTAWDVYTTTDWSSIGFDYINDPSISQLKAGDIFFIAPQWNLPTGHTGVVLSVSNGQVITLEQNFGGRMYVVKYVGGSWSYFGGFGGIVRPKTNTPKKPNRKEVPELLLHKLLDEKGKPHHGKWFISNGTHLRYIRTTRMLNTYQDKFAKLNLPIDECYSSELFGDKGEFPTKNVIW